MITSTIQTQNHLVDVYPFNTVVLGSGAAGYNAADCLWDLGVTDLAMVTEGVNMGTSRNTGSDKQTYYKLTLSGEDPDSVRSMANTLFSGECVDGDNALVEAALSPRCFLKLAGLGVPFPANRYGEYVGYKTDHDPFMRATSAGPLTSRFMTQALERTVTAKGIPVLDGYQAVALLCDEGSMRGMLCLNLGEGNPFALFRCKNLVLATGGPAGIYADSVYPAGHHGATGIALEAGAVGQNLTEWQFGLASTHPRWNVSGTYMQVLPRFLSTDRDGNDAREFLPDHLPDSGDLLTRVFLKGYQWPFDARKAAKGSSLIDLLVYNETGKGRRVFLDFRGNPLGDRFHFDLLAPEARTYLEKAGAAFGTPFERLAHMNAPAIEFYRSRGVDLETQPLEIALCAQHNNGGLAVDGWWQTTVSGLFAVGECAGTHGVYRPGGSALNAGQAGSARAAQYIARHGGGEAPELTVACMDTLARITALAGNTNSSGGGEEYARILSDIQRKMSRVGGVIRDGDAIRRYRSDLADTAVALAQMPGPHRRRELSALYRLRDACIAQSAYLDAMLDYLNQGGGSRGSALYVDADGEWSISVAGLNLSYRLDDGGRIQQTVWFPGGCTHTWRQPRPLPQEQEVFETVWRRFRDDGNVY